MMLRPEYLAQKLTPYPLSTKDGGVLRTINTPIGYLLQQPSPAALTRQVCRAVYGWQA
jgi:hypothetical protein